MVKVNDKLEVSVAPSTLNLESGSDKQLTASVTGGSGTYTYKWYEGDSLIASETNSSITVSPYNDVVYKVVVNDGIENKFATCTVSVVRPAAPTGLDFVKPSDMGKDDAQITGTTTLMEYSTTTSFTASKTKDCTEGSVTGLTPGTYYVRTKAAGQVFASEYKTISIPEGEHTYSDAWSYNGNSHWHKATCAHDDMKGDKSEHVYDSYVYNNDETYLKDGTESPKCMCGYVKNENIPKLGTKLIDDTKPTGYIKINQQDQFVFNDVSQSKNIGLFYDSNCFFNIYAQDKESGVEALYYLVSDTQYSETQLDALDDNVWNLYSGMFGITPPLGKQYIYGKIIDKVGNVTYVGTPAVVVYIRPPKKILL